VVSPEFLGEWRSLLDGMQLDEVAFPILLAWRLHQLQLLGDFNPRVMVDRAAAFLLHSGPVTGEERWEEGSGYSPSTLAAIIAAFICAASFARADHDDQIGAFLESYADFLRNTWRNGRSRPRIAPRGDFPLLCAPESNQTWRSC